MRILHLEDDDTRPPLTGEGRLRRAAPFAAALLIAFASSPLTEINYGRPFWAAVALTVVLAAAVAFVPWAELPQNAQLMPALLFFVVVALLRHSHGGAASGFAPLLLLPVVWLALYGTARQVILGGVGIALAAYLPVAIFGGPLYPAGEWRRATFLVLIAAAMGLAINSLVTALHATRELRAQLEARELLQREAGKIYDDVTQRLTAAKMALELEGQQSIAYSNLAHALESAKKITTDLLGDQLQPKAEARTDESDTR